jgi:hypothetical protein
MHYLNTTQHNTTQTQQSTRMKQELRYLFNGKSNIVE